MARCAGGFVWLVWLGGCVFEPPSFVGTDSEVDAGVPAKDGEIAGGVDSEIEPMDAGSLDGSPLDGEPAEAGEPDGSPDAGISCQPDSVFCDGRWRVTCNDQGDGIVAGSEVACPFTCVAGECVDASNLDPAEYSSCDASAVALAPAAGSTISISALGITCVPDCGEAVVTAIPLSGTVTQTDAPSLGWYCLSRLEITPRTVVVQGDDVSQSIALFVDGDAIVSGLVRITGGDASSSTAGSAGLGAGAGGPLTAGAGMNGFGLCPGAGGMRNGPELNLAAGGGGGGGYGGAGGVGGSGRSPNDNSTAAGGDGGSTCRNPELTPLAGGSGGGSGGDGTCGENCGWPGGGGGGALQISSRTRVEVSGEIDASGGAGYGEQSGFGGAGGGGGGGSGGAILLEAPVVEITGVLRVEGGDGGGSGAGAGGMGARTDRIDGSRGNDYDGAGEGGTGGGGAAGRVRFKHSNAGPTCAIVSPPGACADADLGS